MSIFMIVRSILPIFALLILAISCGKDELKIIQNTWKVTSVEASVGSLDQDGTITFLECSDPPCSGDFDLDTLSGDFLWEYKNKNTLYIEDSGDYFTGNWNIDKLTKKKFVMSGIQELDIEIPSLDSSNGNPITQIQQIAISVTYTLER